MEFIRIFHYVICFPLLSLSHTLSCKKRVFSLSLSHSLHRNIMNIHFTIFNLLTFNKRSLIHQKINIVVAPQCCEQPNLVLPFSMKIVNFYGENNFFFIDDHHQNHIIIINFYEVVFFFFFFFFLMYFLILLLLFFLLSLRSSSFHKNGLIFFHFYMYFILIFFLLVLFIAV